MEWSRAKANSVLPRESTGHSKHPLPTTQEKTLHMDITRWSTLKSDWLYSFHPKMEKLYTVSKNNPRIWLWLRSWTPYCQIQTSIEESEGKPLDYSGMTKIKSLLIIQCREPAWGIPPMTRSCGRALMARLLRPQVFPLEFPDHSPPPQNKNLPAFPLF